MGQTGYYIRTSHYLQSLGNQKEKIEQHHVIYQDEGVSGRVPFSSRPSGKKLLDDISRGKISEVVVLRLDRLGRDTTDILTTIKKIHSYSVPITSINEGITTLIDGVETPMSNLLINVLSSLSEFQYHQTREKVLSGIQRSKIEGKYTGRKVGSKEPIDKILNKDKVKKIQELLDDNVGIRKISRVVGCSTNYVYKIKSIVE